jgi:hypothetical protein
MQDGFWAGYGAAFATIGAVVVTIALVWGLIVIGIPKGTWWTVQRLPLQDKLSRAKVAGVVAGARQARILRIPGGLRLIVAAGGTYDEQYDVKEIVLGALAAADPYDEHEGKYGPDDRKGRPAGA